MRLAFLHEEDEWGNGIKAAKAPKRIPPGVAIGNRATFKSKTNRALAQSRAVNRIKKSHEKSQPKVQTLTQKFNGVGLPSTSRLATGDPVPNKLRHRKYFGCPIQAPH